MKLTAEQLKPLAAERAAAENLPLGLVLAICAVESANDSIVELPAGGRLRVRGTEVAVGNNAFVRFGRIQGEAPNLTLVSISY